MKYNLKNTQTYPNGRILNTLGVIVLAVVSAIYSFPIVVRAAETHAAGVMVSGISPQSTASASEEFVELYNASDMVVNVAGWRVQYKSAAGKSWTTKAVIGCPESKSCTSPEEVLIQSNSILHLSNYELGDATLPFRSGMATNGGQVRLVDASDSNAQIDLVGYGTATAYEGQGPAVAPQPGQGIVRKQNAQGKYIDTDDNVQDFELVLGDSLVDDASPTDEQSVVNGVEPNVAVGYYDIEITEVFPDPASPLIDGDDEFVELYNPYDFEVNLTGYTLKAGTNWSHKFTIGDVVIGPHEYLALMSAQTSLTLSNSGSGVQLLSPDGELRYEMPTYGKAKEGYSWSRDSSGQWVWSGEPTKGAANVIAAETETAKNQVTKVKTTSGTKKSTASTSKTSAAAKTASTASAPGSGAGSSSGTAGAVAWPWVLLGVGTLAGGYAVYEYRSDIGSFLRRAWQALPGAGGKK